ncbi:MAG: hypothetical protein P1U77_28335 [Rubripirellula sp.]|nr:hypothetical protein [Rubripirellula sp.]
MSVKSVFELLLIGVFFIIYLSHTPIMVAIAGKRGFRDTRLNIYSVLSLLPFIVSGVLMLFGPQDLSGRVAMSKYLFVIFILFAVDWLFCTVSLFVGVKNLDLKSKVKSMVSASVSFVLSCAAVVGAGYVTV